MGNPYAPKPPGTPPSRPPQPPMPPASDAPGAPGQKAPGQPSWPQQPAPAKPERPPVDPDEARRGTRAVMNFGLLMLAALVTTTLALPWRMVSVAIAIGALVVGIRAFRRIWRAGMRGTLVAALSAGMVMTIALAVTTLAVIPVWHIEMDRQGCLDQALTVSAKSECESIYTKQIKDFQGSLTD
jgi:hypothetical protein